MRKLCAVACVTILSGWAAAGTVQRIGVDYNTAVAGMANEVTLLNVLRAKEHLPIHYTSFSRMSGSLIVTAATSLNSQIRDEATTSTDLATTTAAPTGVTVARALTEQIVSGGNVYTPQVSGQITTGPSFEIAIYDTQKFYQGVLAPIPFPTIENYLDQGFDNELMTRLLIERIEFRLKDDIPNGPGKAISSNTSAIAPAVRTARLSPTRSRVGGWRPIAFLAHPGPSPRCPVSRPMPARTCDWRISPSWTARRWSSASP